MLSPGQVYTSGKGFGKARFCTADTGCSFPTPCRSLQHPNVLQCLGVCVETLPFLLIMEFCQLVRGWAGEGLLGAGSRSGIRTHSRVSDSCSHLSDWLSIPFSMFNFWGWGLNTGPRACVVSV